MELELDDIDYNAGGLDVVGPSTDVFFDDEQQLIRYETWGDDGHIRFNSEHVEDKREYFKRKLAGK